MRWYGRRPASTLSIARSDPAICCSTCHNRRDPLISTNAVEANEQQLTASRLLRRP